MLLRRLIWTALAVALLVGSAQAVLQQWLAVPLILAAEVFEDGPAPPDTTSATAEAHVHEGGHDLDHAAAHEHGGDEWAPADGAERTFWTWVASVLDTLALTLLALAAMAAAVLLANKRQAPAPRALVLGAVVGGMGWLSLHLWPTLGLPAELPGMQAADLAARQSWWLLAVACAAVACAVAGLARAGWRWPLALALLALPFLVGTPHGGDAFAGFGPEARVQMAVLEQQFHTITHLLALTQWLGIGLLGGWLFGRWVHPLLTGTPAHPNRAPQGQHP